MIGIRLNPLLGDGERRARVFGGDILVYNGLPGLMALCEHAKGLIRDAYAPHDPETAQYAMPVEEFVGRTGPLKSAFTNGARTKELMQGFLTGFGCDPEKTYFDLPRLRVVTSDDYLTSGVGLALKPHRDLWFAHPVSAMIHWLPVFDISPQCAMSMFPRYYGEAVPNCSHVFDYDDWVANSRKLATQQIKAEARPLPRPDGPIDMAGEFRIAGRGGDVMVFSGCHLHATAPNRAGRTRFSIDFRTVNLDDLRAGCGGPNLDSRSKGSTLGDYLRVADLQPLDVREIDLRAAHPPAAARIAA
jgi:hypothetical protein